LFKTGAEAIHRMAIPKN